MTSSPTRLAAVETVYAMTVHKRQGSKFDTAAVQRADAASPILTRELLYAAVSRADAAAALGRWSTTSCSSVAPLSSCGSPTRPSLRPRPTKDVDVVAEVFTRAGLHAFEQRLRDAGFREDQQSTGDLPLATRAGGLE